MPTPKLTDEVLRATVDAYNGHQRNATLTSKALGISRQSVADRLKQAAERGLMLDHPPAMPGFRIAQLTTLPDGKQSVQQRPERGEKYEIPAGLRLKGETALVDADGRVMHKHVMAREGAAEQYAAQRAVVDGFKSEIPRAEPVPAPVYCVSDLLSQYTITDVHMGALAWGEETGAGDYDLPISEQLLDTWFTMAIECAPASETAILAQLGDLLHYDGLLSITPTSHHVLDSDSRYQKMVRSAIRVIRKIVARLLTKHKYVHMLMADANHDPAGEIWLRELFAAFYEDEPRVTVDCSAGTYYVYRHGDVSLFYHHGHRRGVKNVDSVFAGRYREIYGTTKKSYAHLGHKHSDELLTTNLMKVEQHETIAAPDSYTANGGWLSGRSAKVITYHKRTGEAFRSTVTAEMVAEYIKGAT